MEIIPGEPCFNAYGLEITFYAITGSYKCIGTFKLSQKSSTLWHQELIQPMTADILLVEHVT